jgi:arabinogalactan oligomer/maltooligosaccharide transport system permease protein
MASSRNLTHAAASPASRRKRRAFPWRHVIALALCVYALMPLLYVISASLNPTGTLTGSNRLFRVVGLDSYRRLLGSDQFPFLMWFKSSLIIGLTTAVLSVLLGALAAYAFSRMRFRGRRTGLLTIVLVQMFPQLLAVVAIFLVLTKIGEVIPALGLNTNAGLICVYLGAALGVNTYLMYGYFNTVPTEIDEAARVDGASHVRVFFTIILRLVAPILAVVSLLTFISSMNDFVIASVVLIDPERQTLAVGLFRMVSNPNYADWSAFAAGAVMASLPVVALFLYLQKYIVGGLTAGSTK